MYTPSVRSVLLALILSAIVVNASKSVSLKITGPESVDTVQDLKVTTVTTNTGNETLKLLNDPSSCLSTMPADTFKITGGSSDAVPTLTGIKVKYVPRAAAMQKAYTVLAPGQSVSVDHDLSTVYNFTKSGGDSYSFEPRKPFYVVDNSDDSAAITTMDPEVFVHTAKVSGKLAVSRYHIEKRAKFTRCSSRQQIAIENAIFTAQTYASGSMIYLRDHTSNTVRYNTWFGAYKPSRHDLVESHFTRILSHNFVGLRYDCTCEDAGTYAYVYPLDPSTIYLCGLFWEAPNGGSDSRGGTLVHEASHFLRNGGTEDLVYGQLDCEDLAIEDPDEAVNNADSHEYFAENTAYLA